MNQAVSPVQAKVLAMIGTQRGSLTITDVVRVKTTMNQSTYQVTCSRCHNVSEMTHYLFMKVNSDGAGCRKCYRISKQDDLRKWAESKIGYRHGTTIVKAVYRVGTTQQNTIFTIQCYKCHAVDNVSWKKLIKRSKNATAGCVHCFRAHARTHIKPLVTNQAANPSKDLVMAPLYDFSTLRTTQQPIGYGMPLLILTHLHLGI